MHKHSFYSILIAMTFLLFDQQVIAQDSSTLISDSWLHLKKQLLRKADSAVSIANHFSIATKIDIKIIDQIHSTSTDLKLSLDSTYFDSALVTKVYLASNQLSQAISSLLTTINKDKNLKDSENERKLQLQLESMENRIMIAKQQYNKVCSKFKRPELAFGGNRKVKIVLITFN